MRVFELPFHGNMELKVHFLMLVQRVLGCLRCCLHFAGCHNFYLPFIQHHIDIMLYLLYCKEIFCDPFSNHPTKTFCTTIRIVQYSYAISEVCTAV